MKSWKSNSHWTKYFSPTVCWKFQAGIEDLWSKSACFVCSFLYTQQFKVVNPIPKKELLQLATDKNEGQSRRSGRGQSTPLRKCGTYPAYCLHFYDNVPYHCVMIKIFETCVGILLVLEFTFLIVLCKSIFLATRSKIQWGASFRWPSGRCTPTLFEIYNVNVYKNNFVFLFQTEIKK